MLLDNSFRRGRMARQFVGRAARPGLEFAAAVRATALQYALGAGAAEGAFE